MDEKSPSTAFAETKDAIVNMVKGSDLEEARLTRRVLIGLLDAEYQAAGYRDYAPEVWYEGHLPVLYAAGYHAVHALAKETLAIHFPNAGKNGKRILTEAKALLKKAKRQQRASTRFYMVKNVHDLGALAEMVDHVTDLVEKLKTELGMKNTDLARTLKDLAIAMNANEKIHKRLHAIDWAMHNAASEEEAFCARRGTPVPNTFAYALAEAIAKKKAVAPTSKKLRLWRHFKLESAPEVYA